MQEGRHGRHLRRHVRFQLHLRRSLYVDAPKTASGFPLCPFEAGVRGQQAHDRAPDRSLYVGSVSVGTDPQSSYQDVEERACARQYGGSCQRAENRSAHGRRRGGSRKIVVFRQGAAIPTLFENLTPGETPAFLYLAELDNLSQLGDSNRISCKGSFRR